MRVTLKYKYLHYQWALSIHLNLNLFLNAIPHTLHEDTCHRPFCYSTYYVEITDVIFFIIQEFRLLTSKKENKKKVVAHWKYTMHLKHTNIPKKLYSMRLGVAPLRSRIPSANIYRVREAKRDKLTTYLYGKVMLSYFASRTQYHKKVVLVHCYYI